LIQKSFFIMDQNVCDCLLHTVLDEPETCREALEQRSAK
jgi:hypothetical protein